ncbi:hypothetical protein A3C87_04040 [Candidatus Kaiserbacteria bacterium RIFCSPHIGHO2_02_FULL_49_34]|uniref:Type 4 fimbrial biogenesis protein PilX N-terminal domain-containing protein n=1 Tax=Candidatus Kaiserbacteria bacterium RIFCSPHIGHO2_02_FULL_49_34 TaxID=1798491 RepID=A0A1F6DIT4_9BACT|nr:MAG: hypothetical protein A3C87_04040 [Candidatus Kaiserbacteria bacterium RIFCSPHIGHO2_02_FULL_49_34]
MNKKRYTHEGGYVLFLAVIVSTIIVTLGTLVAGFVRQDLALAGAAEQSDVSFYAATSVMTCGRYLDAKNMFYISNGSLSRTIACLGTSDAIVSTPMPSGYLQQYDFTWTTKSGQLVCSILQVKKTSIGTGAVSTKMIARGYNVPCSALSGTTGEIVERVIETNY